MLNSRLIHAGFTGEVVHLCKCSRGNHGENPIGT